MDVNGLLAKAEQFIESARVLTEVGDLDSAASRLYYAMFYVASVLRDRLGFSYASHQAVISAYGKHFAKTQELDPHFHRVLIAAFEWRQLGDYAAFSGITQARVDALFCGCHCISGGSGKLARDSPPNHRVITRPTLLTHLYE